MKYGVSRVSIELACSMLENIDIFAQSQGISRSQAAAEFIYSGINKFVDQIEAYRAAYE